MATTSLQEKYNGYSQKQFAQPQLDHAESCIRYLVESLPRELDKVMQTAKEGKTKGVMGWEDYPHTHLFYLISTNDLEQSEAYISLHKYCAQPHINMAVCHVGSGPYLAGGIYVSPSEKYERSNLYKAMAKKIKPPKKTFWDRLKLSF